MKSSRLLFHCALICVYFLSVDGQNCPKPTAANISFSLNDALDNLSGSNSESTLFNYFITCLTTGSQRDNYRHATIVINFTTNSNVLQGVGCHQNTLCLSYLEISCNEIQNFWERNQVFIFESFTIDPNAQMNISRTDCGSCGIIDALPGGLDVFDPVTHCFGK